MVMKALTASQDRTHAEYPLEAFRILEQASVMLMLLPVRLPEVTQQAAMFHGAIKVRLGCSARGRLMDCMQFVSSADGFFQEVKLRDCTSGCL